MSWSQERETLSQIVIVRLLESFKKAIAPMWGRAKLNVESFASHGNNFTIRFDALDEPPRRERMKRKKTEFYLGEHLTSLDNFIIKYLLDE